MNHTPGPWTTEPCSHGELILRRGEGLEDHKQPFVQIVPEADARLMAAAPSLLKSLQIVLDALGALSNPHELSDVVGNEDAAFVFRTLREAEGRS